MNKKILFIFSEGFINRNEDKQRGHDQGHNDWSVYPFHTDQYDVAKCQPEQRKTYNPGGR